VTQAARDLGVSWPVVSAAFTERATAMLPAEPGPVPALALPIHGDLGGVCVGTEKGAPDLGE
jgi:hypothetical protein